MQNHEFEVESNNDNKWDCDYPYGCECSSTKFKRTSFGWCVGATLCFAVFAMSLGLIIAYSFYPAKNDIQNGKCYIISAVLNEETPYNNQNGGRSYYYRVLTGERYYIWLGGAIWYTITVTYVPPYAYNTTDQADYERTFTDGYWTEAERATAYATVVLNTQTQNCYWDNSDHTQISIPYDWLLTGPIWGIVVMSIFGCIYCVLMAIATGIWVCGD